VSKLTDRLSLSLFHRLSSIVPWIIYRTMVSSNSWW